MNIAAKDVQRSQRLPSNPLNPVRLRWNSSILTTVVHRFQTLCDAYDGRKISCPPPRSPS